MVFGPPQKIFLFPISFLSAPGQEVGIIFFLYNVERKIFLAKSDKKKIPEREEFAK